MILMKFKLTQMKNKLTESELLWIRSKRSLKEKKNQLCLMLELSL